MVEVIILDDWGLVDYKDNVGMRKGVQWGKIIGSIVLFLSLLGLVFYILYPKNDVKSVVNDKGTGDYNITKKDDNYGYPSNVSVPDEAKKIVSLYDEVGQDVSDSDKAKLEAMRDSASVHEAGWDVSLLGSRKYIDYTKPVGLALVYVTDTATQNLLANHLLYAAGYGKDIDDMYPIAYRVKNVQDYPIFVTVKDNKVVAKRTKVDNFKDLLEGWK